MAGFVSCDEIQPEAAVGCVTVDNEQFCALTSAIGNESDGNQKWAFYDDAKVRVNVSGYRCRCDDNGRHLEIDLSITLYRETKGDIRVLYKGATDVKSASK